MSDDPKKVVELVPPGEPLPTPEDPNIPPPPPVPPQEEQPRILAGYVAGIKENGELFFEILGTQVGLVELLGIHEYAKEHIRGVLASKVETVDSVVLNKLNSIIMLMTSKPPRK